MDFEKHFLDDLIRDYDSGKAREFLFFWGHQPASDGKITKSCLSQWYECEFNVDGVRYHTAEQYMMARKALLFGDEETYQKIMEAQSPKEYKRLGRLVKGYDDAQWRKVRYSIVVIGNIFKFCQNPVLKQFLLQTGDRILVEASPYDRVWGCGLTANTPGIDNPHNWTGKNLLGFALSAARAHARLDGTLINYKPTDY